MIIVILTHVLMEKILFTISILKAITKQKFLHDNVKIVLSDYYLK